MAETAGPVIDSALVAAMSYPRQFLLEPALCPADTTSCLHCASIRSARPRTSSAASRDRGLGGVARGLATFLMRMSSFGKYCAFFCRQRFFQGLVPRAPQRFIYMTISCDQKTIFCIWFPHLVFDLTSPQFALKTHASCIARARVRARRRARTRAGAHDALCIRFHIFGNI